MTTIIKLSFLVFLFLFVSVAFAQEKIKVGVAIPLTGSLAEYGEALKNGILLAQKEKADLLKNIDIRYEDSRYDNATTVSIINKFSNQNDMNVVYLWGYGPSQAAAPVAESKKIPVMAISGEQGVSVGKKYVTRFCFRIEQLSLAILGYIRSKNWKNIGIVKTEIAYMNGILEGLRSNLKSDESLVELDSYQSTDTDFKSTIQKLKTRNLDVLGVFLLSGQISSFYKQAHDFRYSINTFGASPFENLEEIKHANGLMNGSVFPGIDVKEDFENRYVKEYGNDVQLGWASNAYDFVVLTGMLAKRFVGNQPKELDLLNEYKKISLLDGEEGFIQYKEDLNRGSGFEFPIVMKRMNKESIVVIPESRNW